MKNGSVRGMTGSAGLIIPPQNKKGFPVLQSGTGTMRGERTEATRGSISNAVPE